MKGLPAIPSLVRKIVILSTFVGVISILLFRGTLQKTFHAAQLILQPSCAPSIYTTHVLSYDPLIVHIENFVTEKDREHLLQLANPLYKTSRVASANNSNVSEVFNTRTSSTAMLPSNDSVVRCIIERAAEFQGLEAVTNIENLQATRYREGQQFKSHYDWSANRPRATTFFAILESSCTNCGTHFPLVRDWDHEDKALCQFVECSQDSLVIRPVAGSAVFWRNLHSDGTGDTATLHAGLPLTSGTKVGLNIWTRTQDFQEV